MSWPFQCRLLSVFATVAIIIATGHYTYFLAAVIGLGFVHYALSFYYARRRIHALVTSTNAFVPLLSLGGVCALLFLTGFSLEIYFGLHHAFNEAYLRKRPSPQSSDAHRSDVESTDAQSRLAPVLCLLQLAAYFCILRDNSSLRDLPPELLWVTLVAVAGYYFYCARRWAPEANFWGWLRSHNQELLLLVAVLASLLVKIEFLHIVLYHFVLWTILPIPAMQSNSELGRYMLLTTTAAALVVLGFVYSPVAINKTVSIGLAQFYLWSYIHITASFALSDAHPLWLRGIFKPEKISGHQLAK